MNAHKLPEKNIPIYEINDNKIKCKKKSFIFKYDKFKKEIIDEFSDIIKDESREKFINTCNFMFRTVRFGVFVFIYKGEIHTYRIFANRHDKNKHNFTKKVQNIIVKDHKKMSRKHFKNIKNISLDNLNFSNCLINSGKWWDKSYADIYFNLIKTCVKNTNITTVFFLNLPDYPVLYKKKCDRNLAHDLICNNNAIIDKNEYIPVFSGATDNYHYDKCIVYADAWEIITGLLFYSEKFKSYTNKYDNLLDKINTNWDTKIDSLIFRGKNNSCYLSDFEKNDRLKTIMALNKLMNKKDFNFNIDVGFTELTKKKTYTKKYNYSDRAKILKKIGQLKERVPMNQQSNFKYILDIDGYVTPWRLCFELKYNSCIVIIKSKFYSWFYNELKDKKNCLIVDIDNNDKFERDLEDKLLFINDNPDKCKNIAHESTKLYSKIMNIDYVKKYMCDIFNGKEFDLVKDI